MAFRRDSVLFCVNSKLICYNCQQTESAEKNSMAEIGYYSCALIHLLLWIISLSYVQYVHLKYKKLSIEPFFSCEYMSLIL